MPSEKMEALRSPIHIPVQPFFRDHGLDEKAVLPAVFAMQILADEVSAVHPEADLFEIADARFDKFLHLAPGEKEITAIGEQTLHENGDITAKLLTKTTSKKASISRVKTHARMAFRRHRSKTDRFPSGPTLDKPHIDKRVSSRRIYRDLVPFGPAFRNITDELLLSVDGAVAAIQTPAMVQGTLGSPFAFDAALHAACVWGQRYAAMVTFPVGFKTRRIFKMTRADTAYACRIVPLPVENRTLCFDLWIYDLEGVPFEAACGVRMRDVSAGRMQPPKWIVADR